MKQHISILKNYNEVKDMATVLIAKIAEQRRMTISEVMKEMGVDMASKWSIAAYQHFLWSKDI